jgi:hypothetical protein
LLTDELAKSDLADKITPEAVSRIGYEWLASLADRYRADKKESDLTAFLRQKIGIAAPGQDSNRAVLGLPHATSIPTDTLDTFAASELPHIRDFVDHEIRPFMLELSQAADERRRPDPEAVEHEEGNGLEAALRLLRIYEPKYVLASLHHADSNKRFLGLTLDNLAQRVAVELVHLFDNQPRLRRCLLCNRIFVPRSTTDSRCQANLWTHPTLPPIEFCIPPQAVEAHNDAVEAGQHKRERKRRHQKMRRDIERFGKGTPRANQARAEYDAWIHRNAKPRGPAPPPVPDLLRKST